MKSLRIVLLIALLCFSALAQTEKAEESAEFGVESIVLAKDNGMGKSGEESISFSTSDTTIHCLVTLTDAKIVTVKLRMVAIEAKKIKNGTVVAEIVYKTKEEQNRVRFKTSPEKVWLPGKYRAEILLDGKLSKSLDFEITGELPKEETGKTPSPKTKKTRRN